MNRTMFLLTIFFFALMLSSARFKDWVLGRKDWQFVVILTVLFAAFTLLMLRSFKII